MQARKQGPRNPKKRVDQRGVKVSQEVKQERKEARRLRVSRRTPGLKEDKATANLHKEGSKGVDLRSSRYDEATDESMYVPVQSSVAVTAQMNFDSLRSCALGVVLDALSRGWRTTDGAPYYAAVYLYEALKNVAKGIFPALTNAPQWWWLLCDALYGKDHRFKTGTTQYDWQLVGTDAFDPITIMDQLTLVFGTPSAAEVNGLSVLTVPLPYTEAGGADAIQSLFEFYPSGPMTSRVTLSQGASHAGKDVSAFATVYPEIGSSYSSPGGVATTLSTECFIDSPVFSQFALYQTGPIWRGFQEYRKNAGTPMSVIPRMLSMRSPKECNTKISPIYKFWDFDEFFEVLSLTLGTAMQVREGNGGVGTITPITCPLTPQQVQILLRQSMLQVFKNQFGQDLRYNSSNALDFYPMSVANNGVDYTVKGIAGMQLPQLLAENIRAAGRMLKQVHTKSGIVTYDTIPILGRYDKTQLGNYVWTDKALVNHDVYSTDILEVPINIRNMSAVDTLSQTVYLDANGPQIQAWVTKWNAFMQELSQNLTPLTCPGKEKGINALSCSSLTGHHVLYVAVPQQLESTSVPVGKSSTANTGEMRKKVSTKGPMRIGTLRETKKGAIPSPGPGSDFYQGVTTVSVSSTYPLLASVWTFQKSMILPSYIGDGGLNLEGTVSAQQSFQVETKLLVLVPDGEGQVLVGDGFSRSTLYEKHLQMATMDVKSTFGEEGSETERALNALIAQGRGGWFTSIAGTFLEAVGVKGAKSVADTLGYYTGL